MKPINQMRSLPLNVLPVCARVDFLHFLACDKPAVRTKLPHELAKSSLEDWCINNGYILRVDSENFACIAREAKLAEWILEIDQSHEPHEQLLGLLLGYPKCCCDFIASIGESCIDAFEQQITKWNFSGNFKYIDPSNYLIGSSLICHIPCSSNCQPSLDLANQAINIIYKHKNESCLTPWLNWLYK